MNPSYYIKVMTQFLKRYFELVSLTLLTLLVVSGCVNNQEEKDRKEEQKLIDAYLAANHISADTKTDGGIYYVEDVSGTGKSPVKNDYIIFSYVSRYLADGSIHETNYDSLKNEWSVAAHYKHFLYGPTKMKYGYSCPGLNEGIGLMKEGGKARIIMPSEKAYCDGRPLVYEIKLLKVIHNIVTYEDSIRKAYFVQNSIDTTKAHYKKIIYLETGGNPNDTLIFDKGDTIRFRFTGKLVEGYGSKVIADRVFDSNTSDVTPAVFFNGKSALSKGSMLNSNKPPSGLIAALDSMRVGVHATVILPYSQAFGPTGIIESTLGYMEIPPYQTVIYDVQVEKIIHPDK